MNGKIRTAGRAPAWAAVALTGGDKPKTIVLEEGSKVSVGEQSLRKVAISAFQVKYVTDNSAVAYRLEGLTSEALPAV